LGSMFSMSRLCVFRYHPIARKMLTADLDAADAADIAAGITPPLRHTNAEVAATADAAKADNEEPNQRAVNAWVPRDEEPVRRNSSRQNLPTDQPVYSAIDNCSLSSAQSASVSHVELVIFLQ
jgi:hypothetical protein